jgi:hypothetical protein
VVEGLEVALDSRYMLHESGSKWSKYCNSAGLKDSAQCLFEVDVLLVLVR